MNTSRKREGYEGERKENNRWNRADRRKIRDSVNCKLINNKYNNKICINYTP